MTMDDLLPCFVSHYSLPKGVLTLEPKGKGKKGGCDSIVDICVDNGIKDCILIDSTLGGAFEAAENLSEANINLFFGYKVVVCVDETDKSEKSFGSESKVIIFSRHDSEFKDLVKIANKATTDGFYYIPRISWKQLKEMWSDNLVLGLPFFSSFIARNTLTINTIVPELPMKPIILIEENSELPFAPIIEESLKQFNINNNYPVQRIKTIYYKNNSDFEKYIVYRANKNRATFEKPNLDHMGSDKFSFEDYEKIRNRTI